MMRAYGQLIAAAAFALLLAATAPAAPPEAVELLARSKTAIERGEYDRAIGLLGEAIRIDPDLADAYQARGLAYQKKGDSAEALADYDRALRLKPDTAELHAVRGRVYAELGRIDQAKADLVKLRYFAGLTNKDAAGALGISTTTADRYWTYARAWLCSEISDS